jgi:hypothetical protein
MRRRSQGTAGTGNQVFNKRRGAELPPPTFDSLKPIRCQARPAHGRHLPEPRRKGEAARGRLELELLGGLLDLAPRALWPGGLGSSTLTLLQLALDRFQCVDFVRLLDRRDLAHQPV